MNASLPDNLTLLETRFSPLAFGAIGDAYGYCFEFAAADHVQRHNNLRYVQHPEFTDVSPGVYSDDTQMQLALAELMLSGAEWSPDNIAQAFVQTYKRAPRPGYAKRFAELLGKVEDGADLQARLIPTSDRNGAAMRAPIIGLLSDEQTVIEYARIQAAVTHDTAGGRDSAIAAALILHFLYHQIGPKADLPTYLASHLPDYDWKHAWQGSVPCHGISTVMAALTAIMTTSTLSQLLHQSIAFTGDVDSVATIAMTCASCSPVFARDLPTALISQCEHTTYGLPYLVQADQRLITQFR